MPGVEIESDMRFSQSIQMLCVTMVADDIRHYINGAYDRCDWDVVLVLSRMNTAGNAIWKSYPIDDWMLDEM